MTSGVVTQLPRMSKSSAYSFTTYHDHRLHIALHRERLLNLIEVPMPSKASSGLSLTIDGLGLLALVAEAVPALEAPVKGSVEALKQILQYAQARPHLKSTYWISRITFVYRKPNTTRERCLH
jgi:hypothetical protein